MQVEVIEITPNGGNGIENKILKSVREIMNNLKEDADVKYSDNTIREIYILSCEFSKRLTNILTSENINVPDGIFLRTK